MYLRQLKFPFRKHNNKFGMVTRAPCALPKPRFRLCCVIPPLLRLTKPVVKVERIEVTGSRIKRTDMEGLEYKA